MLDYSAKKRIFLHMNNAIRIIFNSEIQQIFDRFAASFGLAVVFYSLDGTVLRRGRNYISPFCLLIHRQLSTFKTCLKQDEEMCHRCSQLQKPVSYRCHAGIEETVVPVYVKGQLIGYGMIGQFRITDRISPEVFSKARKNGLRNELRDAFEQLPFFSRERAENIIGLFSTLLDYIVTKEIISVKGERIVGRILTYIEEHLTEEICIQDVAQAIGQSVSTVSHRLKQATGQTFTQLLNESRIQRAEKSIRQNPECSIQEISEQVGFNDPFYFSRVYRKLRGVPPNRFRTQFIEQTK